MSTDARIVKPGQLEPPVGEIPFLFLPAKDTFARRAERFRRLAPGNALEKYLGFLALLADAQQHALNRFPAFSFPGADEQTRRQEQGVPMLDARSLRRDAAWREVLALILEQMGQADIPAPAREAVFSVMQERALSLEEKADSILREEFGDVAPRELPFIASGLQVYWVRMASSMQGTAFRRLEQHGLCPVCGSRPTAGLVQNSGQTQGLRYLSCSLCASQWHLVRITCSTCGSVEGINHYLVEGSGGAVKAETCSACRSYLKLLYLAKDPRMEAMADDVATLSLDLLMEETGRMRGGPNLFFHPGERAAL